MGGGACCHISFHERLDTTIQLRFLVCVCMATQSEHQADSHPWAGVFHMQTSTRGIVWTRVTIRLAPRKWTKETTTMMGVIVPRTTDEESGIENEVTIGEGIRDGRSGRYRGMMVVE